MIICCTTSKTKQKIPNDEDILLTVIEYSLDEDGFLNKLSVPDSVKELKYS